VLVPQVQDALDRLAPRRVAPVVELGRREDARDTERLDAYLAGGVGAARQRQDGRGPPERLLVLAADRPEPAETGDQAGGTETVAAVDRVAKGRRDVAVLGVEDRHGVALLRPAQAHRLGRDDLDEVIEVGTAGLVDAPPLDEAVDPELAQRLQHPVPRRLTPDGDEQRLVGKGLQHVLDVVAALHRRRAGHRHPAREDGDALGETPLVVVEQVPAPLDHGLQRAVPRQRGATAACQQPEPVRQACGDLVDGERAQPGSRQLDRERLTVQTHADLADAGEGVVVQHERPVDGLRPQDEQTNRAAGRGDLDRVVLVRHGQGAQLVGALADDAQRLTARRDDAEPRSVGEQVVDESRHAVDEVLAVVEHEQPDHVAHGLEQARALVVARSGRRTIERDDLAQPHRGQHGLDDVVLARDGCELDEPAGAVTIRRRPGRLDRHARLARSAGAEHRDQAVVVECAAQVVDDVLAAHERGEADRQRRPRPVRRLVAAQDRQVQVLQLGRRVDAELVGQHRAQPLVRRQSLVGTAVRGQPRQVEPPEPVAVRVLRRQRGQLGDDRGVCAHPCLEARLGRDQPELGEAVRRGCGERDVPEVGERVTAPQRQGVVRPTRRHEALEPQGVDAVAVQDVARRGRAEHSVGQPAARARHHGLQRVGCVVGDAGPPQVVDQRRRADRAARGQGEPCHERTAARPAEVDLVVVDAHPQRSEDVYLHPVIVPPSRAKAPGVTPRVRRKCRMRCAWSWKPTSTATSAAGIPSSSSRRARSTRRPVT
jgi:hypothetical protein